MKEKRRPWWDSWSAIFLIIALFLLAERLVATNWTDDLHVFVFLALIASVTGLALGQSRFSAWLAAIFGTAYGLFFIPFLLGLTINETNPFPVNSGCHLLDPLPSRQLHACKARFSLVYGPFRRLSLSYYQSL